ncbi:uncharacterized protein [Malus domestica]|uniref:uncharacterized protein n=1 Tax=Malus domestica TaxID=3750 RepID=UPI0039749ABB
MTQLQPINLCNVIYKICSKVLTTRLKIILSEVVSPFQSAFIPGRLISNNCLVASEIAHYMHRKNNGGNGVMVLKLDISKVYDQGPSALYDSWETQSRIQGVKVCKEASSVHHLLFADDSFIFARSSLQECIQVKELLRTFELASEQAVNLAKSSMAFSRNLTIIDSQLLFD